MNKYLNNYCFFTKLNFFSIFFIEKKRKMTNHYQLWVSDNKGFVDRVTELFQSYYNIPSDDISKFLYNISMSEKTYF